MSTLLSKRDNGSPRLYYSELPFRENRSFSDIPSFDIFDTTTTHSEENDDDDDPQSKITIPLSPKEEKTKDIDRFYFSDDDKLCLSLEDSNIENVRVSEFFKAYQKKTDIIKPVYPTELKDFRLPDIIFTSPRVWEFYNTMKVWDILVRPTSVYHKDFLIPFIV